MGHNDTAESAFTLRDEIDKYENRKSDYENDNEE